LQIGGQLSAGFLMTDFYEDDWNGEKLIDNYFPSFFAKSKHSTIHDFMDKI
jgi:hypothetical protein